MLNYIGAGLILFSLIFVLSSDVSDLRHALPAGLIADTCSILLSCWMIRMFFGH